MVSRDFPRRRDTGPKKRARDFVNLLKFEPEIIIFFLTFQINSVWFHWQCYNSLPGSLKWFGAYFKNGWLSLKKIISMRITAILLLVFARVCNLQFIPSERTSHLTDCSEITACEFNSRHQTVHQYISRLRDHSFYPPKNEITRPFILPPKNEIPRRTF